MAIVNNFVQVKETYRRAAENGWVIPCFCSENLTTCEAVLSAAQDFAVQKGLRRVPVTLAITVQYSHRPQACHYTHTRRWDTGLKLFLSDVAVLADKNGPFPNVDVLLHLDHIQHDDDAPLLEWDLSGFSSIMYDASTLPLMENIRKTAAFVEKMRGRILVEGACDEIYDASMTPELAGVPSLGVHNALTAPENAKKFWMETGADMIVANLGTEHRASAQDLYYHGDMARQIKEQIGPRIVLHGLSSVPPEQVKNLYNDGICKVNIWTMLERDASPVLLRQMAENAGKIAGKNNACLLVKEGYLGPAAFTGEDAALSHFTTVWRQDIVFAEMKKMVTRFLEMWYVN